MAKSSYTIRCSRLPLVMSCASSLIPAEDPIHENDTDPQNIGRADHDLLRMHVEGHEVTEADISHVCTRERANQAEVGMRLGYGMKVWDFPAPDGSHAALKRYFDRVGAEEPFTCSMLLRVAGKRVSVTLTGHPDLGGSNVTLDWKGGRVFSNAEWQLQGYCYATRRMWSIVAWLMDKKVYVKEAMLRKDFEAALAAQLALVGKEYGPGEHCGFCPRRHECAALRKCMQSTAELLKGSKGNLTTAEDLARVYPQRRLMDKYLKMYDHALDAYLDEHGSLPLGDGTEVYIREEPRREVDVQTAWPVLAEALTVEQLAMCVKLGVTAISEAVKQVVRDEYAEKGEKVPKGELGKAVKVMWEQLGEAGAVSEIIRRVKATRKVKA